MLELTIAETAILLSIALLSISLAVQVQGRGRSTIAVTVSVLICTLVASVIFLGFSSMENPFLRDSETSNATEAYSEPVEEIVIPDVSESRDKSVSPEFLSTFLNLVRNAQEKAQASLQELQNFPLQELSKLDDYSFESLQKNSLKQLRTLSKLYKQIHALKSPTAEYKQSLKDLKQSLFHLRSSARAAQNFLNAKSELEEQKAWNLYQKDIARAENLINALSF